MCFPGMPKSRKFENVQVNEHMNYRVVRIKLLNKFSEMCLLVYLCSLCRILGIRLPAG